MMREATAVDREGIEDLRQRCFPDDPIDKRFPPARVFIAEADGRPVAHLAFVEQTYVIDGREVRGAMATDAMTDPAFRRRGLFRQLAGFARDAIRADYGLSTAWQIRPAVLPAMRSNGWLPILRAPVFVRPSWGTATGVRPRSRADFRKPRPDAYAGAMTPPWRFSAPYYTCSENLVTREAVLKGKRTLCVVDVTGEAKEELRTALANTECALAAALLSWRHPALPLLLRLGFVPGPHWFRFLVNVFDPSLEPRRARWALSWADTDHL